MRVNNYIIEHYLTREEQEEVMSYPAFLRDLHLKKLLVAKGYEPEAEKRRVRALLSRQVDLFGNSNKG